MIRLPSNVTVAALSLVLGVLLGAGAYHALDSSQRATQTQLEGEPQLYELGRFLTPRDTSDQDEAATVVRYKTRTDTLLRVDTVRVPTKLGSSYLVSSPEPIRVESGRVEWTAWNPRAQRYEQKIYSVPDDRFEAQAYALLQTTNPRVLGLPDQRVGLGLGLRARWGRLSARVEGTLSPALRPRVSAALVWGL